MIWVMRNVVWMLPVFLACKAASVGTTSPEASEAIAAVEGMFAAMRGHDVPGLRAIVMPGANIVRVGTDDGGRVRHLIVSDEDFVRGTAGDASVEIDERFTTTPTVHVDGALASVWGPYQVSVDGEVKHCGVNAVQLARLEGRWTVTGVTYNVRPCG